MTMPRQIGLVWRSLIVLTATSVSAMAPLVASAGLPPVGTGSCTGAGACVANTGAIGNDACIGAGACANNAGPIGNNTCVGAGACAAQEGMIDDGACHGASACASNAGAIGNSACNGANTCAGNTAMIGSGLCNFDFACLGNANDRTPCLGDGASVAGIPGCWFFDADVSCTDACSSRGLVYDEQTRTVAGSDATDGGAACLVLFGEQLGLANLSCGAGEGLGCRFDGNKVVRCTSPDTVRGAAPPEGERRACACLRPNLAPAQSHAGLAVTLLLLLGSGVCLAVRRRTT